jgi:hypothetical protein
MAKIKIISVPEGIGPQEVRQAWVGLQFPCPCFALECELRRHGLPGDPSFEPANSYLVFQSVALKILNVSNPVVGEWWRGRGFPQSERVVFSFHPMEVEVHGKVLSFKEYEKEFGPIEVL